MTLNYPVGYSRGLKPRRDDLRGRFRRFRDRDRQRPGPDPQPYVEPDQDDLDSPPVESWDSITDADEQPDLGKFITGFKDQENNGSCGAEGTTQFTEILRRQRGMNYVELNPLSLYHYTSGGVDRGSGVDENLVYAQSTGIVPMDDRDRSKGFLTPVSEANQATAMDYRIGECFDVEDQADFAHALMLGYPVVFGWDAHCVCAVKLLRSHKGTRYFKAAGSWGAWVDPWERERRYRVTDDYRDYLRSEITPGYHLLSLDEPEIERYGAWAGRTVTWDE